MDPLEQAEMQMLKRRYAFWKNGRCHWCRCQGVEVRKASLHFCELRMWVTFECVGCGDLMGTQRVPFTEIPHVWGADLTLDEVNSARAKYDLDGLQYSNMESKRKVVRQLQKE